MTNKPKYSTIQQHQPLYAPKGWNEEEKRFVQTLKGILEDIYRRYGRLGLSDLSKVFRGTVNGLESDMGTVQGSVTTLAGAFEQLNAAVAQLNASKLAKSEVLNAVYPIGSLYMSVNNADPGTLFGGTWERLKDRFLLAAGDAYAAGTMGGEATHTLSIDEMPIHNHPIRINNETTGGYVPQGGTPNAVQCGNAYSDTVNSVNGTFTDRSRTSDSYSWRQLIGNNGKGAAHNNMPPYLAVWVWKRTA